VLAFLAVQCDIELRACDPPHGALPLSFTGNAEGGDAVDLARYHDWRPAL
jgi:hypothetical protein